MYGFDITVAWNGTASYLKDAGLLPSNLLYGVSQDAGVIDP